MAITEHNLEQMKKYFQKKPKTSKKKKVSKDKK